MRRRQDRREDRREDRGPGGGADAGGGGLEPAVHRRGRLEQKLPLFGENQPPRVAVEQRRAEAFLQRANLPADRGLRQVERLAGMGQTARIGDHVKYPELVPIHRNTFTHFEHRTLIRYFV